MFAWLKRRFQSKRRQEKIKEAVAELLSLADALKISRVDMALAVYERTIDFDTFDWTGEGHERRRKVLNEVVRVKLVPPARWTAINSDPNEFVKVAEWLAKPSLIGL